jgi:hypothetical protein
MPGLEFSDEGFKTKYPGSDRIRFSSPIKVLNKVAINPYRLVALTEGGPGKPSKLRFDLADFGFSMYFAQGIELKVNSTSAPYLTWKEGTYGPDVPTPDADWVGISFQDRQPALVFGFPEDKTGLKVTGELGSWTIKSSPGYKGWLRVSLPFGTEPYQATTARAVGRLSERCVQQELLWYGPIADLPEPTITEDPLGLDVAWKLPRQKTVLPNLLFYAQYGSYPVKIQSLYTTYPSRIGGEPVLVSAEPELRVRFPVRRIPNGRGLSLGELLPFENPEANWKSPTELVTLALANTLANRARSVSPLVKKLLSDYYEASTPVKELNTKLNVFYDQKGKGMLSAAVHSLLTQSANIGQRESPADDPQFISLSWRQDPYTGSLGLDQDDQRRVLAIASIAGAFATDPELRLRAAMMESALSAERGKEIWLRRQGVMRPFVQHLEPLLNIRKGLFSLTAEVRPDPIISNWFSDLRVFSSAPVWLNPLNPGLELCWEGQENQIEEINLNLPYQIQISSKRNVAGLFLSPGVGSLGLRYEAQQNGQCAAVLGLPTYAEAMPLTALPPRYTETML